MNPVALEWDADLLKKYDISGPRYTSYPTALEFSEDYQPDDYVQCLQDLPEDKSLSLYLHIPFCENICYYCACNKVVTRDFSKAEKYVDYLCQEIEMVASQSRAKTLRQIHWGGGTPTFLSLAQINRIMDVIRNQFDLVDDESTEISIEVDPRALDIKDIAGLAKAGFNRMSLGVQDFDPKVQASVNRIQPFDMTKDMVDEARRNGFQSINLDLIYGLPLQTQRSFEDTLNKVEEISPDRISVFNYAHLPHRFKPQRRINDNELPSAQEKLAIFEYIIDELQSAGYSYIGMDHFAKPEDELAIAQAQGELHRNFQGYTTHQEYQLIGVGVSAIGSLLDQYHQNVRTLDEYYAALDENKLPGWRGVGMTYDDKIRKAVIFSLICHFSVTRSQIEKDYSIDFDQYFANELELLRPFIQDKLVILEEDSIQVTARGRLLIRNICMMFDAYLNDLQVISGFSKVI